MIHVIDNSAFNITLRSPPVLQFDGSTTFSGHRPLQSDITTSLSFALNVMRIVSGMWTASMAWRCTFVLMEKTGVSLKDIRWIATYNMPAELSARRGITIMIIAIILILAFPSQLSAPILTGSITWAQGANMVLGDQPVTDISLASDGAPWSDYRTYKEVVSAMSAKALGIADTAWSGHEVGTTMKRVLRSTTNLPVNSTLNNVTIPYFTVDAIEWIKDPALNASDPANQITQHDIDATQPGLPGSNSPYFAAALVTALIPDGGWGPPNSTGFPSPTTISETRTLWALYSQISSNTTCGPSSYSFFGGLPSDVNFYADLQEIGYIICIAFARVTYTAGAAVCESCRLSAPTVAQPDAAVQVIADPMTFEATTLMPLLSTGMYFGGSSAPPAANITQYIMDILPRSYGAAWTALSDDLTSPTKLTTGVKIPVPVSIAHVLLWRVYLWVVLNLMLTLSGILFLCVQYVCVNTLVVDTGVALLLLDTQRVQKKDHRLSNFSRLTDEDSQVGLLRLRNDNGHKYVDVE